MGSVYLFLDAGALPFGFFGIALAGLITGITGTGLGGLTAFFPTTLSNRFQSTLLEFTTGIMISMVCMDLLPEGYKTGGF